MPDLLSFLPLVTETIDTIRQRLDTDATAGVDPNSENYIDTTEGGWFWDITQATALEIARLWDVVATEVPASAFPAFAWGEYLDNHGQTVGLSRKDATNAQTTLVFTGTNGTLVAAGTEVQTVPPTGDDPIVFSTNADVTIASGTATIAATADDPGAAGNVPVNNLTVMTSPNPAISSVTNPAGATGGADVETDDAFRDRILLQLSQPQGAGTVADYERWALAYDGVGFVSVTPVWNGPGTVHVVITDPSQNPTPDSVTFGLQDQLDPPAVETTTTGSVTLPTTPIALTSTTGFAASGSVRLENQTVTYTGVSGSNLTGCTGGTGTYAAGTRVAQGFGLGAGQAPIGAVVTVDTVTALTVTAAATITHQAGYSLDGTGGTIATRSDIQTAIEAYIGSLSPGQSVILAHVIAAIFSVVGVLDVSGVTLNGSAANVTVGTTQVARPGTPTLS